MSVRRLPLLLLFAVLVSTGCGSADQAAINDQQAAATSDSAHFTPSRCWQATVDEARTWTAWLGGPAVSCNGPHTLETYATGEVTYEGPLGSGTGSRWKAPAALSAAASEVCNKSDFDQEIRPLGTLRMYQVMFLPTKDQWLAGDRTVRCDIGAFALGSEMRIDFPNRTLAFEANSEVFSSPQLDTVATDPDAFGVCFDGYSKYILAQCSKARARMVGFTTVPQPIGGPYPGYDVLNKWLGEQCRASSPVDTSLQILAPRLEDWKRKINWGYCIHSGGASTKAGSNPTLAGTSCDSTVPGVRLWKEKYFECETSNGKATWMEVPKPTNTVAAPPVAGQSCDPNEQVGLYGYDGKFFRCLTSNGTSTWKEVPKPAGVTTVPPQVTGQFAQTPEPLPALPGLGKECGPEFHEAKTSVSDAKTGASIWLLCTRDSNGIWRWIKTTKPY